MVGSAKNEDIEMHQQETAAVRQKLKIVVDQYETQLLSRDNRVKFLKEENHRAVQELRNLKNFLRNRVVGTGEGGGAAGKSECGGRGEDVVGIAATHAVAGVPVVPAADTTAVATRGWTNHARDEPKKYTGSGGGGEGFEWFFGDGRQFEGCHRRHWFCHVVGSYLPEGLCTVHYMYTTVVTDQQFQF